MYWAKKGEGAFLNGEKIFCSQNKKLSDCIGMLEYNAYLKEDYKAAMAHALKIFLACQDIRTFASTAISLCYIACGKADVFLGRYIKPWTMPGKNSPYLCLEPWNRLPALTNESGKFSDKPYLRTLKPGEEYSVSYKMEI